EDYLQHVFHATWVEPQPAAESELAGATYVASEDPADATGTAVASGGSNGSNGARGNGRNGDGALGGTGSGASLGGVTAEGAGGGGRSKAPAGRSGPAHAAGTPAKPQKLGRNDPCSCGSGKKYKLCHGAN
ncbi:MAG TPA: SEC-C metal-binding domain-containing protein, partial [Acidimicrobiales bacterium]|nr:SEC-C metal-binding domain-containing protein [Acidimicrobiales bacterium]